MTRKSPYLLLSVVLLFAAAAGAEAADEIFPQPPALRPDVDFWISIFTRYDSDTGVLHDNRHLGVVYETMPMSSKLSRRERQRRVGDRRKQLQAVLRSLAGGKRDNLSAEEARVLALGPDTVSNETLRGAVNRIRYQQGLSDVVAEGFAGAGGWRDLMDAELPA